MVLAEIFYDSDSIDLVGLDVWMIPPPLGWRGGTITAIERDGEQVRLSCRGLETVDQTQALANTDIVIDTDHLDIALTARIVQSIASRRTSVETLDGYTVTDGVYGPVGTIRETIQTGANEVWVVEGRYGEVLVPVICDVVEHVDDDASAIKTRLLPGLIERDPL